jgi:hypothetical protein
MNVVVACGVIAIVCGVLGSVTIYFVQTISRLFAIRIVADLRSELARHFLAPADPLFRAAAHGRDDQQGHERHAGHAALVRARQRTTSSSIR